MKIIDDEGFRERMANDPATKALGDFIKATGKPALVVIAVDKDHQLDVRLVGDGDICQYMFQFLQQAAIVAGALGKTYGCTNTHGESYAGASDGAEPPPAGKRH